LFVTLCAFPCHGVHFYHIADDPKQVRTVRT
jgi:hypothetical protein